MNDIDQEMILGVEGGGTKTTWVLLRQNGNPSEVVDKGQLPAANFSLIAEDHLRQILQQLPSKMKQAGVFLAGCSTVIDRTRLQKICEEVWPLAEIVVGGDRESGFAAAFGNGDGIAVIGGTGSAVTGWKDGKFEYAGGRGHLLGDRGGGYIIGLEGLRLALRTYDLEHRITPLAQEILRALMLNRMEDLIAWTQGADKTAIAGLSPVMFGAAQQGDREMLRIIEAGADSLAVYTRSVARWLEFESPAVKLQGGIFLGRPMYVDLYKKLLESMLATSSVEIVNTPGAVGAAWLASSGAATLEREKLTVGIAQANVDELENAATEQTNPRSAFIDRLSAGELVDLFITEEQYVVEAISSQRKELADAVQLVASVFNDGGRLFYVGAGTSGRLGALDASEIPPTFGESPQRVQAIIAGGVTALHSSVEGAEDNAAQGKISVIERGVTSNDVVCGITASGRTPFVIGALNHAKEIGAKTILLTCNPARVQQTAFDVEIDLPTGPELITGSTRLKAGTATKVTLNILSTCALVLTGRTQGNLMVGMRASNSKLRQRAIRMVSQAKGVPPEVAEELLESLNWNVAAVIRSCDKKMTNPQDIKTVASRSFSD